MRIIAPYFVEHSYTQHLVANMDVVFPLLCPVREAEWIEGWDPPLVFSASGVAEENCVFLTGSGDEQAIWIITEHDPDRGVVEYVETTPGLTVARIRIRLYPADGDQCTAVIRYRHTALSPAGRQVVANLTAEQYQEFMQAWEAKLNHYLASGKMLRGTPG